MFSIRKKVTNSTQLFEAVQKGDYTAYEKLFTIYYPRLVAYATRFVASDDEARDLVQDVFVTLWEKRASYTNKSVSSLLFTMVRNACLNRLKHLMIVENHQQEFRYGEAEAEKLYQEDFMNNTSRQVLYSELQEQIEFVISKLPRRSKEVFVMSRFYHLKNAEIAERLQISVKAVEKNISRALREFKNHFDKYYQ